MIQLRNLEKSYKTKEGFTYMLHQVNLDINEGDFITFMGPSGILRSVAPDPGRTAVTCLSHDPLFPLLTPVPSASFRIRGS